MAASKLTIDTYETCLLQKVTDFVKKHYPSWTLTAKSPRIVQATVPKLTRTVIFEQDASTAGTVHMWDVLQYYGQIDKASRDVALSLFRTFDPKPVLQQLDKNLLIKADLISQHYLSDNTTLYSGNEYCNLFANYYDLNESNVMAHLSAVFEHRVEIPETTTLVISELHSSILKEAREFDFQRYQADCKNAMNIGAGGYCYENVNIGHNIMLPVRNYYKIIAPHTVKTIIDNAIFQPPQWSQMRECPTALPEKLRQYINHGNACNWNPRIDARAVTKCLEFSLEEISEKLDASQAVSLIAEDNISSVVSMYHTMYETNSQYIEDWALECVERRSKKGPITHDGLVKLVDSVTKLVTFAKTTTKIGHLEQHTFEQMRREFLKLATDPCDYADLIGGIVPNLLIRDVDTTTLEYAMRAFREPNTAKLLRGDRKISDLVDCTVEYLLAMHYGKSE
jgi:hypothetical protein